MATSVRWVCLRSREEVLRRMSQRRFIWSVCSSRRRRRGEAGSGFWDAPLRSPSSHVEITSPAGPLGPGNDLSRGSKQFLHLKDVKKHLRPRVEPRDHQHVENPDGRLKSFWASHTGWRSLDLMRPILGCSDSCKCCLALKHVKLIRTGKENIPGFTESERSFVPEDAFTPVPYPGPLDPKNWLVALWLQLRSH